MLLHRRPGHGGGEGLETDYQGIIASHFRRWGVSNQCVTIEVRKIGQAPDGYDVFVGMVRLVRWERHSALRVLLGLPLLEAKIRKTVRATWLADYSHFTGLWLHTSEQLQVPDELRELLVDSAKENYQTFFKESKSATPWDKLSVEVAHNGYNIGVYSGGVLKLKGE